MSNPLAVHTLHRLASMFAPSVLGSGSATAPPAAAAPAVAHVDPVVVGALLVAVGVIYAFIILAAICIVCWPRRLKWPASAHATTSDLPRAARPAGSHRPHRAQRAAGAHPLTNTAAPDSALGPAQIVPHPATRVSRKRDKLSGPAVHDGDAWPTVEREVEGVGLVQWDAKTVRAFAGHPDVLQRLAFQRWRYQAGRCPEFAPHDDMPRRASGEPRTPRGQRADKRNENSQQPISPRPPRSRQPLPPTSRPTRVAQPTGGGASPA